MTYTPREYWSAVAEEVERRPGQSLTAGDDSPFIKYKHEAFVERMLKRVPFEGKAVLEVGCGPGGNLVEVMGADPRRLVGCDVSPKMIELAGKNTAGRVECVELADGALPFETEEFDISFTSTVLQHNRDETVRGLIAEMSRVTAETIYLFEDTTSRSRDLGRFVGWITGGTVTTKSYFLRPVSYYAQLFATHGFDLVDVGPLNVYASDVMRVAVWFLDARVTRSRGRREGERLSLFQERAEHLLLPLTKAVDPKIKQRQGLTAMTFHARPHKGRTAAAPPR